METSARPGALARLAHLAAGVGGYPALHAAQWRSPDELRALQWRRLRELLAFAYRRSPLYRRRFDEVGVRPGDIRSLADLRLLPTVNRDDLRRPDELLAEGYPPARLRSSTTSGSTGRRTTSYFDERAWVLGKHLLKLRARLACGVRPWDRIALFQEDAPDPPETGSFARMRAFTIHRPIAEILPAAVEFNPTVLYGFPGHLARLAVEAEGRLRPRLVFTSGEVLDPTTRRAIESGLSAPVLDVYGCTEIKEIAWQCPERGGYHLNADWTVVEADVPEGADPAQGGRLLLTSLVNRAMPLLRYDIGDTGIVLEERCACGRGLPLIRPTLGRSVDYIDLPDGRTLAPYSLTCAVEAIEGMRQYQFVQTRRDRLELRVVPTDAFDDRQAAALVAALRPVVPGVQVDVREVASIPSEPSGKYRIVRSQLGTTAPVGAEAAAP